MSEISPRDVPAPAQRKPGPLTDARRVTTAPKLSSERVIVAAPMSFAGSAQRIWRLTERSAGLLKAALGTFAVVTIVMVWMLVLCWYLMFGLLLVPYRVVRRGQRKSKRQALQHREMLTAIERQNKK